MDAAGAYLFILMNSIELAIADSERLGRSLDQLKEAMIKLAEAIEQNGKQSEEPVVRRTL
jgi:hypothetical protein